MTNWLSYIRKVYEDHEAELLSIGNETNRINRLCELNVIQQAVNVCRTDILRAAWGRGQAVAVHAWIYGLQDGLIRDLDFSVDRADAIEAAEQEALKDR